MFDNVWNFEIEKHTEKKTLPLLQPSLYRKQLPCATKDYSAASGYKLLQISKSNDVKIEELYQDSGVSYNVLLQTFDHATVGDGLDVLLVLPDPGDGGPAQDT